MNQAQHKQLSVMFVVRSTIYFYNTKSIAEAFLRNGHNLRILFGKSKEAWTRGKYISHVKKFKEDHPEFEYGEALYQRSDGWRRILLPVRGLLSYRRYLVVKGQSTYFRDRLTKQFPFWAKHLLNTPGIRVLARWALQSKCAGWVLQQIEKWAPLDPAVLGQLQGFKPDVLLLTVGGRRYGSFDLDYLHAAKALGIPTAILVLTWDSLSSKALIQEEPDILLAWNKIHVNEAAEHHNISREKSKIIGAPVFDGWFPNPKPSCSHKEFCYANNLPQQNQFILYIGSPASVTHDEGWLVSSLRIALNNAKEEELQKTQIIFRPHPAHFKRYAKMDIPGVHILPKRGQLPDNESALQYFYDTLFHAKAVVGVNTSAMIESVIADKPVIAMLRDEYTQTQSEAVHFKHLRSNNVLTLAETSEECVNAIRELMKGNDIHCIERRKFIEQFIRPHGLSKNAGERAVQEIEQLV